MAAVTKTGRGPSGLGLKPPLALTVLAFLVGYLQKLPCHLAGWPYRQNLIFGRYCYSDLPVLFRGRGLAAGVFPYAPEAGDHPLEYPVLTGLVMDGTARLTRWLVDGAGDATSARAYYDVNVVLLLGFALATVAGVWAWLRRTGGRPGDAVLVAAAPTLALAGTINWDLVAVAAAVLALVAWAYDRPVLAGVLIGLGTAAKLFPAFILLPLLLVCLRERRLADFLRAVAGALAAWVAANLPLLLVYPDGWLEFWRFNAERGADYGALWYALWLQGHPVPEVNRVSAAAFAVLCAGIAALAWFLARRGRRPPTLAELTFLTVAAFLLTNKVYSPQYVLWLLPLAVLARGRSRGALVALVVWQVAEVAYWAMVWRYLAQNLGDLGWLYPAAIYVRIAALLYLCGWVIRDMLVPPDVDEARQVTPNLRQVEPSTENAV